MLNESLRTLDPSPHPEPFFRVAAKNEGRGQESVSILSKIYVTLSKVTITLLGGRRVLVSVLSSPVLPVAPGRAVACPVGGQVPAGTCSLRPSQGQPPEHSMCYRGLLWRAVVPSSLDVGVCWGFSLTSPPSVSPLTHLPGWGSASHPPRHTF